MLRLPAFRYLEPRTLADALRMKDDAGPHGMYVAGGTDLYPNMKRRQQTPAVVVSLMRIPELTGAGSREPGAVLAAGLTLTQVAESPGVRRAYPAVARAAELVSTPLLRNMGTIGGNLCLDTRCNYYDQSYEWRKAIDFCMKKDGAICWVAPGSPRCWAVQSSDTVPVVCALEADVELVGRGGTRRIKASELYRDDGIQYLTRRADEIITEIRLPPAEGWRSVYLKLRRRGSFDFPILGVAAAARFEGEIVREARIVLGAVASLPREATKAAGMLIGQRLTSEVIEAAADAAAGPARPLDNTDLTHPYRKKVTRVYVARALARLAGLDQGLALETL